MPDVDPWIGPRGSAAQRVLQVLREHGSMTRAELARLTGMSVGGIRPIVGDLLERGEIIEPLSSGSGSGRGRGRPGRALAAVIPDGRVIGLDFGHAHVTVAVADLCAEQPVHKRRALDVDHEAGHALECAAELAGELLGESAPPLLRVVAGLPGPIDRSGRMRSSTIASSWFGLPIAECVGERLGLAADRVDVENDAHLGALGELRSGAATGCADVVYVKASHGLGAGLVLGGELYRGADGLTGELGHTVVQPDGELCRCGGRGCLETAVAVERVREQVRFVVGGARGEQVDLADVAGHAAARRIVADAGRALGRALADVCNLLNPQRVVLGGELALAGAPLVDGVVESIRRFGQAAVADTDVVLSALGEDAQLVGAVHLAAARARAQAWA